MYRFRIEQLTFNDESTIEPPGLTVFVGPNNSGKSRVLRDAVGLVCGATAATMMLRSAKCGVPSTYEELEECLPMAKVLVRTDLQGWAVQNLNPTLDGYRREHIGVHVKENEQFWKRIGEGQQGDFLRMFGPCFAAHLTTDARLSMVKRGNTQHDHTALLQDLYKSKAAEKWIRKNVQEAFGLDLALDFSTLSNIELRVGEDFRDLPVDPRDARPLLELASRLDEQGDGVRAFVGIVTALHALRRAVYFIDEPEAFLHPPQALRVGELIAEQVKDHGQIFVATHSADVLRGIISKRPKDTLVVRIDRTGDKNSYCALDVDSIRQITIDPLLSSARVLEGLFYPGCVVVEADADARLYQLVSRRLSPDRDFHFVNADNKQTVPRILQIYRKAGVRSAGIVDIDAIDNGQEFTRQLEAVGFSEEARAKLLECQATVSNEVNHASPVDRLNRLVAGVIDTAKWVGGLEEVGTHDNPDIEASRRLKVLEGKLQKAVREARPWDQVKKQGTTYFTGAAREAVDRILVETAANGLFINPVGELECLLQDSGHEYQGDKRAWINRALPLVAKLEVKPEELPWSFLCSVHAYLREQSPGGSGSCQTGEGLESPMPAVAGTPVPAQPEQLRGTQQG